MDLKKKTKIGILTQYYNSHNYGGLLQSYAMVQVLGDLGFYAEQISYNYHAFYSSQMQSKRSAINCLRRIKWRFINLRIQSKIEQRHSNMDAFANSIAHSRVYENNELSELDGAYDAFIAGSDQVWNPKWYDPVFFLDFVKQGKKIAYAPSISQKSLTNEEKKIFIKHLPSFDAVSLRENQVELIQPFTDRHVQWVLDPTLLLHKEQWDLVCAERLCIEPYVFCYFLGVDMTERRIAKKFAEERGLKLVSIPFLSDSFEKADKGFGDIQFTSASPEEFISLIKYANFVFTDSFHASVFSQIYERQFFTFQRIGAIGMSSRIYSLLELFGNEARFCDTEEKQTIGYINRCATINYNKKNDKIIAMQANSIRFLKDSLESIESR